MSWSNNETPNPATLPASLRPASVSSQFGLIIGMVVNLVVLAYAAAGLSLVVGTKAHRPTTSDRLLGIGALFACVLLLATASWQVLLGSAIAMLVAWILFRVFGNRRDVPAPDA